MVFDWVFSCAANASCGRGVQRHAVLRQCILLWWKWRRAHSKSLLWSCLSDLSQTWSWEQLSSLMAADHHTSWLPIMSLRLSVFHMHIENCLVGCYPLAPPSNCVRSIHCTASARPCLFRLTVPCWLARMQNNLVETRQDFSAPLKRCSRINTSLQDFFLFFLFLFEFLASIPYFPVSLLGSSIVIFRLTGFHKQGEWAQPPRWSLCHPASVHIDCPW